MNKKRKLLGMITWAHSFLSEVLLPGDCALDLTAGTGMDTLFLHEKVGAQGQVLAFDVQQEALEQTSKRLKEAGAKVCRLEPAAKPAGNATGVYLVEDCHGRLENYLSRKPRAVVANLGYLPGGDKTVVTRSESTGRAVKTSLSALLPGGRLVIVAYVGHPGGREEAEKIDCLLAELSPRAWSVLRIETTNNHNAPYVIVAEKRG